MRFVRLLTAALLSVAGLVVVGATTQSASANSLVLNASYSSVIKFEPFTLSGKVITPKVRTVKLQYKSGDTWVDKASKSTNADGSFQFGTYTGASRYYRYYAPKSGTSPTIIGAAKKITLDERPVSASRSLPGKSLMEIICLLIQGRPSASSRTITWFES